MKSSFLLLIQRIFIRSIGLVSMLVLARLLSPSDFGIVAIVSSVVFLFNNLTQTGVQQYIIRKDKVTIDDLNSCFTLNFLLKISSWALLLILIPHIAEYLNDDRIVSPLIALSFVIFVLAFHNPGIYLLEKDLQYAAITKIAIVAKVFAFFSVMLLAILFRTYWAMVMGVMIAFTIRTVGSYIIHDHRPRFRFIGVRKQWVFSKWIFLRGIVGYIRHEFDTFLVTRQFGLESVGGYTMMKNLSLMPASDIIVPLTQPLLSSFSAIKNDPVALKRHFYISQLVLAVVIFPIVGFVFASSYELIHVLLGPEWVKYSYILKLMMLLFIAVSYGSILTQLYTSLGNVKFLFTFEAVSVLVIISALLWFETKSVNDFTLLRTGLGVLSAFIMLTLCTRKIRANLTRVMFLIMPSVFNTFIAYFLCYKISYDTELITLLIKSSAFFGAYLVLTCTCMLLLKRITEYSSIWNLIPKKNWYAKR